MAVVPIQFEHFGVVEGGGFSGEIFFVIYRDGIAQVKAHHPAVLDVDGRHPILGGRQNVAVVKPEFVGARGDVAIPVDIPVTQAQVPLAHDPRLVALPFQEGRQGKLGRVDKQGGVARQNAGLLFPPGIHAGEQGEPAGGTGSRTGIAVSKAQAPGSQGVDVRGLQGRGPVGPRISVPEVVGVDQDDVGQGCRSFLFRDLGRAVTSQEAARQQPRQGDEENRFHTGWV